MASFKLLENKPHCLKSENCYVVSGEITEDDVRKINSYNTDIMLILKNTKNQNSEVIKKLKGRVKINVVGGLNYFTKEKFKSSHYIERTTYTPSSIAKIIEIFDKIESKIRYSWTDKEKCMFVYKTLAEYLHYKYDNEKDFENGKDVVRSLDGLIYGKLVCSGFALVFKEAMDRLGIPCIYQNRQGHHSWNIVELDGKKYGMELTWDCSQKGKDNQCHFYYFGRDKYFYNDKHHDISGENEETIQNLSDFSSNELSEMYGKINVNNGNVLKENMKRIIDDKGNSIYYICLKRESNAYIYLVYIDNKLNVITTDTEDNKLLSKANILNALLFNSGCIGNINNSNNEFMKYIRKDKSEFIIKKSKRLENNMYELYYFEVIPKIGGCEFRRGVILSEMDLSLKYDESIRNIIANSMLSKDRVGRKINYYNGYVGFINSKNELLYNVDFEKDKLGIVNRK